MDGINGGNTDTVNVFKIEKVKARVEYLLCLHKVVGS